MFQVLRYNRGMARFKDRVDASEKLLPELRKYLGSPNTFVVGLPRGGMVTASMVARGLGLPLRFLVVKKIGAPGDPELAIGAISEDGEVVYDEEFVTVDEEYKESESRIKLEEAQKRGRLYRGSSRLERFDGSVVILVDDGMATGSTMQVAVKAARARGAKVVIVAVPVASLEGAVKIKKVADGFICPEVDRYLESVGEYYEDFPQIEDDIVLALLNKNEKNGFGDK